MGAPYTEVSIADYNSNPPPDDGTQVEANRVKWATHKTKLTDPIKTAVESINSNVASAFGKVVGGAGVTSTAVGATVGSSDQGKLVRVTGAGGITITTPDATGVTSPFSFCLRNDANSAITLDGNGSQTVDGQASVPISPGEGCLCYTDGSNWFTVGRAVIPPGVLVPFAGSTEPAWGYFPYGQNVSRTTDVRLFTALSTAFGTGDGSTTFGLPDGRGRALFGKDNMGGSAANRVTNAASGITGTTLGATGGAETVTIAQANLPSYSLSAASLTGTITTEVATSVTVTGGGSSIVAIDAGGATSTGIDSISFGGSVPSGGSGTATNKMPPTIITNYVISRGI